MGEGLRSAGRNVVDSTEQMPGTGGHFSASSDYCQVGTWAQSCQTSGVFRKSQKSVCVCLCDTST